MNIKYLKSPGCQPGSLLSSEENKIKKAAETAFLKFETKPMRASRKPSSVRNFRSWVTIYLGLSLPAGSCDYQERDGPPLNAPIPILHRVGFTWRTSRQAAGELLPRLSILTAQVRRYISVALSLESPPPDVIRHPALWSSDFPHTVGPHAALSV